uniref:hypothetical protein n=1 Tax=Faecalibacillus intestinalis TaxID=1982626 RepID=UPI0022E7240F
IYVFNMEEANDIKTGKDFDYKNVTDYKGITVKQVPMLIHVENKKIDHITKQVILKKHLINKNCYGKTLAYYSMHSQF